MPNSSLRENYREDAPEPEEWPRQTPTTRRPPPPLLQPLRSRPSCPMTFYMREAISLSALAFPHIDKAALRIQFPREDGHRHPTTIYALLLSVGSPGDNVYFRGNNVTLLPPGLPPRAPGLKGSTISKVNSLTGDHLTEEPDSVGLSTSLDGHQSNDNSRELDGGSSSHLQEVTASDMNRPTHRQSVGTHNETLNSVSNEKSDQSLADPSSNDGFTATSTYQQKIIALKSLWDCLDAHLAARRVLEPDADDSTWGDYASDMTDEGEGGSEMVIDADDIAQTAREAVEYAEELERVHELPTLYRDGDAG